MITRFAKIKTPVINMVLFGTVGLLILFAEITTIGGYFEWTTKSLTEEVIKTGTLDPDLIKGRMTFKEVADAAGIPKSMFHVYFIIAFILFYVQNSIHIVCSPVTAACVLIPFYAKTICILILYISKR